MELYLFIILFVGTRLTVQVWMAQNSLCRAGWPGIHKDCLCLQSAGTGTIFLRLQSVIEADRVTYDTFQVLVWVNEEPIGLLLEIMIFEVCFLYSCAYHITYHNFLNVSFSATHK